MKRGLGCRDIAQRAGHDAPASPDHAHMAGMDRPHAMCAERQSEVAGRLSLPEPFARLYGFLALVCQKRRQAGTLIV